MVSLSPHLLLWRKHIEKNKNVSRCFHRMSQSLQLPFCSQTKLQMSNKMPDSQGAQGICSFSTNYNSSRCTGLHSRFPARKVDVVQKKGKIFVVLVCLKFWWHKFGGFGLFGVLFVFASFWPIRLKHICLHNEYKVKLPSYLYFNGTIETTASCCQTASPKLFSHVSWALLL